MPKEFNQQACAELAKLTQKVTDSADVAADDHPELCQDSAMFHIDEQGNWLYQNSPLPSKFAKMFFGILHCIDGQHYLITPVEKVKVSVARFPLVLTDFEGVDDHLSASSALAQEQTLIDATSLIGTEHKEIKLSQFNIEEQAITVKFERGIIGILGRACYYRFINQYLTDD
ncbi:DUF1285 domain-containing protein [Shewanella maritima]|uniref:DUF1285 domain-containing protein n=1 Tax=Shewanella maritima TaxID=2520507 RepID=UPI003736EA98